MIYTVTWTTAAQNELANLWINASDRQDVTDAANRIDRELRIDPDQKGSESNGDRIYEDEPLAVTYAVFPDDRRVEVREVRRLEP